MALKLATAVHQVNLLLLLLQEQGDLASMVLESRATTVRHARDSSFARQLKPTKSTSCAFPYTYTTSTRKDDEPTVCYRQQWNPCHMDFGLVFQQAIDRQDRTLQSRRTLQLYWNHWSTPWIQEYPHYYYRTRTHRTSMTCLVGYTPLRLLHTLQDTISQTDTSQETPSHRAPP